MPGNLYADTVNHIKIDGGEILNCFGWSYKMIQDKLDAIKAANFTAVQVSSVQPLPPTGCFSSLTFTDAASTPIPDWYRVCAPLGLRIITDDDTSKGHTPLGTLAELKSLIAAAHAKGIGVVAAVEANQVYASAAKDPAHPGPNDHDTWMDSSRPWDSVKFLRSPYDASHWTAQTFNDVSRKSFTQATLNAAVLDFNTEDTYEVIPRVQQMVKDLWNMGVDGIYWYHAKYIGLQYGVRYSNDDYGMPANDKYNDSQAEDSGFWPAMLQTRSECKSTTDATNTIFYYGNINLDPYFKGEYINLYGVPDHDPNQFFNTVDDKDYFRATREYTKYMCIADAWYAKSAMMQDGVSFAAGYFNQLASSYKYKPKDYTHLPHSLNGFYAAQNTDLVYLAEDENTYLQNPEVLHEPMIPSNLNYENRPTNIYGTDVVNRTYAAMAGHNNVTLVYFARPSQNAANFILGNKVLSQQSNVPYCYFIDSKDWTKTDDTALRAYYYGGKNTSVDWPGIQTGTDDIHHTELKKVGTDDCHNVYILKFTDGNAPQTVIFNNKTDGSNGSQTTNLSFASGIVFNADGEVDARPVVDKPVDDFYHIWVKSKVKPRIHAWIEGGNALTGWNTTDGNGGRGEPTSTIKDEDGNTWYFFALPKQALDQVNFIIHANNQSDNQAIKPTNLDALNNMADMYYVYDDEKGSLTKTSAPEFSATPPTPLMTVYIRVKDSNAALPNLYYWKNTDGSFFCDWPGTTLKHRVPTTDGSIWYYARIPRHLSLDGDGNTIVKPENLIINSNGKQTANITGVTDAEKYYYFDESTVSNGTGYNNVTTVSSLPDLVAFPTEDISTSNAFTDKHIAAVNKFHTSLQGENDFKEAEYNHDGTKANIETICRQNGAIMVMRDPTNFQMAHTITNPSSKLQYMVAQGETVIEKKDYKDAVTGVTFTVGKQNIKAPANAFDNSGIAVITNENKKDPGYNISVGSGTQGYGSIVLKVTTTGTTKMSDLYYQIALSPEFKNIRRRNRYGWYRTLYRTTGKIKVPDNGEIEINYTLKQANNLTYSIDADGFRTYYVRFYNGKEVSQEPYVYYIRSGSASGTIHAHVLYFRFPETEVFDRNNVTLYAWDDEDGNSYPLVKKGGDKLADESNSSEWTWPADAIFDASEITDEFQKRRYDIYTGKDLHPDTYDVHYGNNYNDVVYYGGHKISRYTVGLPNLDLRLIKFRLSYHNPYGFTQQLEPKIVDDDQYYDVALDKDGNLGIGGMYVMIGDALYDNNTWKYTTPITENSTNEFQVTNTFWKMQTLDEYKSQGAARGPVFMNFDPDESRSLSTEGHKVEVATYTGQFIQGKTFRFGTPFDLRKSFVKDETVPDSAKATSEDIAAGIYNTPYKIYLKDVDSTYKQGYVGNEDSWRMVRGIYARHLSRNGEKNEDLTWELPSGIYTVKLYSINDNGTYTYYCTISRPTVEYDYMAEADDRIPTRTREGMLPMSVTEDGKTKIKFWYKDIPNVGHPGYPNTEINIYTGTEEQQSKFKPDGYTLEAIDNTAGTSNTSLLSNFPETGRYRVVYTPGYGNTPKYVEETTDNGKGEPTPNKSYKADSNPTLQCFLGFRANNYDANRINATKVKEDTESGTSLNSLSGHWTSYSDGLPRKKPSQVTAYYASGYHLDKYGNLDAVYLTKLSGDILPANTGLLLQYPTDVGADVNYDYGTNVTVLGKTVNSNFVYMEPENTETTSATIMQPSGTNYLIPFIANDNSVTTHNKETEWKEHANIKRPESEFINSILAYRTLNDNSSEKVLDFFKIGEFSTNYELRKSFLSIPKNDPNVTGSGDVVFNAKPRMATASNLSACVVTDHIDVIFGTNQQVPTGIKVTNIDNSGDNAPYYNLQGIRVEHPTHGIFIHNGKKVVIR